MNGVEPLLSGLVAEPMPSRALDAAAAGRRHLPPPPAATAEAFVRSLFTSAFRSLIGFRSPSFGADKLFFPPSVPLRLFFFVILD